MKEHTRRRIDTHAPTPRPEVAPFWPTGCDRARGAARGARARDQRCAARRRRRRRWRWSVPTAPRQRSHDARYSIVRERQAAQIAQRADVEHSQVAARQIDVGDGLCAVRRMTTFICKHGRNAKTETRNASSSSPPTGSPLLSVGHKGQRVEAQVKACRFQFGALPRRSAPKKRKEKKRTFI